MRPVPWTASISNIITISYSSKQLQGWPSYACLNLEFLEKTQEKHTASNLASRCWNEVESLCSKGIPQSEKFLLSMTCLSRLTRKGICWSSGVTKLALKRRTQWVKMKDHSHDGSKGFFQKKIIPQTPFSSSSSIKAIHSSEPNRVAQLKWRYFNKFPVRRRQDTREYLCRS